MSKCFLLVLTLVPLTTGRGLLLLHRPRDISNDCVVSHHLRYDLSFGMGMSDTITVVLRNLKEIDYECAIEIVNNIQQVFLLVVIRFPNAILSNCVLNSEAFVVLKKNKCLRICDLMNNQATVSPYFIISVRSRFRFRFLSNSSINSDMDANVYQVTATSARTKPKQGCNFRNETACTIRGDEYCFTSGVVCDGIKNCGVTDWFDERKSECELPLERIGYAPVVAVIAVLLCVLLAASHIITRYLPQSANSFFIFNANEDNRLCINPVFKSPDLAPNDSTERQRNDSLIPISSSSSEDFDDGESAEIIAEELQKLHMIRVPDIPESGSLDLEDDQTRQQSNEKEKEKKTTRMATMRLIAENFQQRFLSVAGRLRASMSNNTAT